MHALNNYCLKGRVAHQQDCRDAARLVAERLSDRWLRAESGRPRAAKLRRAEAEPSKRLAKHGYLGAAAAHNSLKACATEEGEVGRQRVAKARRARDELSKRITNADYLGQQLHKQRSRKVAWWRPRGW